jgi:hypothetical protein
MIVLHLKVNVDLVRIFLNLNYFRINYCKALEILSSFPFCLLLLVIGFLSSLCLFLAFLKLCYFYSNFLLFLALCSLCLHLSLLNLSLFLILLSFLIPIHFLFIIPYSQLYSYSILINVFIYSYHFYSLYLLSY